MQSLLLTNIGDLVTFNPLVADGGRRTGISWSDLGRKRLAWLAVIDGKIAGSGEGEVPAVFAKLPPLDAKLALVIPGLVDAHTHMVFAGSRAVEFVRRLDGVSYQQIAAEGGGIQSSVMATRDASQAELSANLKLEVQRALQRGITTIEVKSGYGLSIDSELKLLEAINEVAQSSQATIVSTCLALHAIPKEASSADAFIDEVVAELLPQIARRKLAHYVDSFIEEGYYSVDQVERYYAKARELGLGLRVHADEFTRSGGAQAAAKWQAASADHLQFSSEADAAAMAKAGVTAVILPGTSLYTKIPFTNARRFLDQGVPTAIASDFNPGSCMIDDLGFLAVMACLHCGFQPPEALAAITTVAAGSLGLGGRKGCLTEGFDADFCLYDSTSIEDWFWQAGRLPPRQVYVEGTLVSQTACQTV